MSAVSSAGFRLIDVMNGTVSLMLMGLACVLIGEAVRAVRRPAHEAAA